jgi:hypothetical protein
MNGVAMKNASLDKISIGVVYHTFGGCGIRRIVRWVKKHHNGKGGGRYGESGF